MKDAFIRVQTADDVYRGRCTLYEKDGTITLQSSNDGVDFCVEYSDGLLKISKTGEISYELAFKEGLRHSAVISTPLGSANLDYVTASVNFERALLRMEWKVEYTCTNNITTPLSIVCLRRA